MNALTGSLLDGTSLSSSVNEDAVLLADCARATELDAAWRVLYEASADLIPPNQQDEAERAYWASIEPEWRDLLGRIYGTRPRTSKGRLAKARFFVDCLSGGESDIEQSLIADILQADGHFGDFIPATSPNHPDAGVVTAVEAFIEADNRYDEADLPDEECDGLVQNWDHALAKVTNTRALTMAGFAGKARVLIEAIKREMNADDTIRDQSGQLQLAWALAYEIIGVRPLLGARPAHPDAALIAACSEYLRIRREFEAYYDTLTDDMQNDDPAWAMLDPIPALTETIVALRATTAEGHVARARCVAFHFVPGFAGCQDDPDKAPVDRLQAAALRDLVHAERGAVA